MEDILGTRMKQYERAFTEARIDTNQAVYARLDGRSFSRFTKNLTRPFDARMSQCMIQVTEYLVQQTKADLGYTQSDEISLMWKPKANETSQFLFDGKLQKLTSTLASMCAGKFLHLYMNEIGEPKSIPSFDCRILNIPENEVLDMFEWRQQDARRNAIQMVAHHYLSNSRRHGLSNRDAVQILATEHNVNFHTDFPDFFKYGTFITRQTVLKNLTAEELAVIPEEHRPEGPVERTVFVRNHQLSA